MESLTFEKHDDIGIISFNRPQSHNALNQSTLVQLLNLLQKISRDNLKAILLTGSGDKSFVSGADIKEMSLLSPRDMHMFISLGQEVASTIENSSFLTLAAVNGYCLGGGLEMALACDFIVASPQATFGLPEVSLGMIPAFGGTQRLTRLVGYGKAKEMIVTGKIIDASSALQIGLINQVIESKFLIKEALLFLQKTLSSPLHALIQAKKAIQITSETSFKNGLETEKKLALACFSSQECAELMEKFSLKRKK